MFILQGVHPPYLSPPWSDYKFAVKPHALHYWLDDLHGGTMADAGGSLQDQDTVIISIDPDFLFMKPFGPKQLGLVLPPPDTDLDSRKVIRQMQGRPVAHYYTLGHAWLKFNRTKICGPDSPCLKVSQK